MKNMFEQASKKAIRFNTIAGQITTEDLWKLPLQSNDDFNLDDIAKGLRKELKENEDESFVTTQTVKTTLIELKFEIIKYIIKERLELVAAKV